MVDLTEIIFDFIVVGSGPSGVMCAQTLTEAGKKVLLLDAGITAENNIEEPAGANFVDIRETVRNQHEIFLGKNFERIEWGQLQAGAQVSAQRKFVTERVKNLIPVSSSSFFPVESLAKGGLGEAWGLGCCRFSDKELKKAGLDSGQMNNAYQVIADRIGISYSADDIERYTMQGIKGLQPAIKTDDNAALLLQRYRANEAYFRKHDFFMGIPALAMLTENKGDRLSTQYNNMDFYANEGLSAYKPSITLNVLQRSNNFQLVSKILVTHFNEEDAYVQITGKHIDSNETYHFRAKKLLLATNVLNTARIVLRSFEKFELPVPVLCNPYSYITGLQLKRLGRVSAPSRTSTVQLSLFHDAGMQDSDIAMASLYTYSSLLLQQLVKELPFNFKDGLFFMHYLVPAMVIAGVHHPDSKSDSKFVQLIKDGTTITGDILQASYIQGEEEKINICGREKLFCRALRKMGCLPLKKIQPDFGASVHYAGTLPFSDDEKILTTCSNGRLACTKNIFIADGSGFNYLPAKGITFTLMANAHVVALNALKNE